MLCCRQNALVYASIENHKSGVEKAKEKAQHLRIPVPEARVPLLGFVKSLTIKQLICGTIAGAASSAATAPLAIIRTKVLAGNSTQEVINHISRHEGLFSYVPSTLSGWMLTLFIISLRRGVQFVAFEAVKRSEEKRRVEDPKVVPFIPRDASIATLSGALSAVAALLVTYPFNTIQDRLILQSKDYPSTMEALVKVLLEEGIPGIYAGLGAEMLRMVPNAAAEFYAYQTLRTKLMPKSSSNIGALTSLLAGATAGGFSTLVTYPLELIRKEISLSAVPNTDLSLSSTWQAFRVIVARDGLLGFYRGIELDLMQIVPSAAVSFVVYEIMKRVLIASGEEHPDEVKDS